MHTYQCNAPHDTLEFSTSDIPEYIRKLAALAAIELTESILRQPDGRRMLAEETARRKSMEGQTPRTERR